MEVEPIARILVLNPGSSSLKFGLFQVQEFEAASILEGNLERLGTAQATLKVSHQSGEENRFPVVASTLNEGLQAVLNFLDSADALVGLRAVGCRVVHGGADYTQPTCINAEVLATLRRLIPLAPLHNAKAVEVLESGQRLLPNVPIYAVFDTGFHATLPEVARHYALDVAFATKHQMRRYGFHGISHAYVSRRLLECMRLAAKGTRLITCHLGSGASLCALRDGLSVDTSMGMTPLEGLVMGTRCGDLDAGALLYLLREAQVPLGELEEQLERRAGLKGLSGISDDLRDLEQAASLGDARASLAMEIFAYRVRKYIGAYSAVLGGIDGIAFSAGIGEHSAAMRRRICSGFEWMGIQLDEEENSRAVDGSERRISTKASQIAIWVIPTDEQREIARQVYHLL